MSASLPSFQAALVLIVVFLLLSCLHTAEGVVSPGCSTSFKCGNLADIRYPFSNATNPECGLRIIQCVDGSTPTIQFEENGKTYMVREIFYSNQTLLIFDQKFYQLVVDNECASIYNFTTPVSPSLYFQLMSHNLNFLICDGNSSDPLTRNISIVNTYVVGYQTCSGTDLYFYYDPPSNSMPDGFPQGCSSVQFPTDALSQLPKLTGMTDRVHLSTLLATGFSLQWNNIRAGNVSNSGTGKAKLWVWIPIGAAVIIVIIVLLVMKKKISPLRYSILNKSSNSKEVKLNGGGEEAKEMRENPKNKKDPSSSEPLKIQVEKNNIKEYSHCQLDEIIQRDKMLGGGAYSEVYEGLLPEGTKVAVKLLKRKDGNEKDFKNEVLGISAASHMNILRLRGYCSEKDVRALVSDYMPMTLLDCITGLDWEKLYKIALGVARGLRYLHMECPKPIIHLDIKPGNILLDKDFTPKISDFGFAKHSLKRKDTKTKECGKGTQGYAAPELYPNDEKLPVNPTNKSDVYSYGMTLLQMLGKHLKMNVEFGQLPYEIHDYVTKNDNKGRDTIYLEQDENVEKLCIVALCCIQKDPETRPDMEKVWMSFNGSFKLTIPTKTSLWVVPKQ